MVRAVEACEHAVLLIRPIVFGTEQALTLIDIAAVITDVAEILIAMTIEAGLLTQHGRTPIAAIIATRGAEGHFDVRMQFAVDLNMVPRFDIGAGVYKIVTNILNCGA